MLSILVGNVFSIMHAVSIAKSLICSIDSGSISLQDTYLKKYGFLKTKLFNLFTSVLCNISLHMNTYLTKEERLYIHLPTSIFPTPATPVS